MTKRKRQRTSGFLIRRKTKAGRKILRSRRQKGRRQLAPS